MSQTLAQSGALQFTVSEAEAGQRLDRWLAARLEDVSRARVQALIAQGAVSLGRATIGEGNQRVKPEETYTLVMPPAAEAAVAAEPMALCVVYEDADVIVIDKPAGLVVHPGAGHASGTLVNALLAHCGASLSGIGGVMRPGIVHRLDKDTSGLLVVAKSDVAHQSLSGQFKSHGADGRLQRTYRALVWGVPALPQGTIDAPLARSVTNRLKIAIAKLPAGRRAVTHYKVLETYAGASGKPAVSLVELQLETGRTHQIRVHLAHIGHPVLGDPLYGTGFKTRIGTLAEPAQAVVGALDRQALHAAGLGFAHPKTGRQLAFESNFPKDLQQVIIALQSSGHGPAPIVASRKKRSRSTS